MVLYDDGVEMMIDLSEEQFELLPSDADGDADGGTDGDAAGDAHGDADGGTMHVSFTFADPSSVDLFFR